MWLLLSTLAHAADRPVLELPGSEDPAAWASAARLVGMDIGGVEHGVVVAVSVTNGRWVVEVHDATGARRTAAIERPTTPQTREDALWIAMSLARAMPSQAPAAPTPPPTVVRTPPEQVPLADTKARVPKPPPRPPASASPGATPSPTPTPTPTPTPSPSSSPSPSQPPPPPPPASPSPPAPPPSEPRPPPPPDPVASPIASTPPAPDTPALGAAPPPLHLWATAEPVVAARDSLTVAFGGQLSVGVAHPSGAELGLSLRALGPRDFTAIADGHLDPVGEAALVLGWSPAWTIAPRLHLRAGAATRGASQGERLLDRYTLPVAALDVGLGVRASAAVRIIADGRVGVDLSPTTVQRGDRLPAPLSPWEFGGGIGLRLSIP